MSINSPYSQKLKQAMRERDMNLTALSRVTGISKSSISQYMSGKVEPSDKRKEQIAAALDLSADYFEQSLEDAFASNIANLPVATAAKLMGKSKEYVYKGLQEERFSWGNAVWMGSRWSYYISPAAFAEWTKLKISEVQQ